MKTISRNKMENDYVHNEDGTTTIYVESLDRLLEVLVSTKDFHTLECRGYNICVFWEKGSRTYYVLSRKEYVHRLITDAPKGMQVHHIDGNGLNNIRENLEVLTPKQHARKRQPRSPIVGDKSKGVQIHVLTKAEPSKKEPGKRHWFRMEVNGIHYGTFYDMIKLGLHSRIAGMVVNEKATDNQIYAEIWRTSETHCEEHISAVIKEVRRFFRTPDPSLEKRNGSKVLKVIK